MFRLRPAILLTGFLGLLAASPGLAHSENSLAFALEYRSPELDDDEVLDVTGLSSVGLSVETPIDSREQPERIGVNIEDDDPVGVFTTVPVTRFVEDALKATLLELGIETDPDGDLRLVTTIRELHVVESHVYRGSVRIKITVFRGGPRALVGVGSRDRSQLGALPERRELHRSAERSDSGRAGGSVLRPSLPRRTQRPRTLPLTSGQETIEMKRFSACLLLLFLLGVTNGCEHFDDENDIIVTNGSGGDVERLTLDGVDQGGIDRGETRKFDDVPDGVHTLAAYERAGDPDPCDTHVTDHLSGDEDDYWIIDEDCR